MAQLTEDERFFKRVEEKVKRAIFDYGLIQTGDRVLIGLSGGKDSLALVELLGHRSKIFNPRFEVVVAHIIMRNIPYLSDLDYLRQQVEAQGLPFIVEETEFDPTTDRRKSPCFLCSWMRRKALFEIAKRQGCGKLALGHHQDDILETLLMNLIIPRPESRFIASRIRLRPLRLTRLPRARITPVPTAVTPSPPIWISIPRIN